MIEFSRIKKITIKEGVVKKITNSSGVILWKAASDTSGDTSSVTVDLNNQWVESTKKLDASYVVYMSNSNKGVANGYASMKFKFKGEPDFKIWINSFAEYGQDYTIAFNLDVDYPTSNPSAYSKGVKESTLYSFGDATSIDGFTEVDYPNDGGEHFVVVTYRKDERRDMYDDRGYVAIKVKPLSTSWVVSPTEFIKDSGKYYQRINEIGTYEGGATALTGNFKEGDELTPSYIQSSDAKNFMIVGSGMYYKKYAWVTPVDTAINTGDYIQGDYIGEYKQTVVTYTDGSTKKYDINGRFARYSIQNISAATNVELGTTVTSIDERCFSGNTNLTALTISDKVTKIPNRICLNCNKLATVKIGTGTTTIEEFAFGSCTYLTSVTIESSREYIEYGDYSFTNISSTAKLYVQSDLLEAYQADPKWTGAFKGGIYAIVKPTVVTYSDGMAKKFDISGVITSNDIENISAATKVEIGDSVTKIADNAFSNCPITSVTIPDSVVEIGESAFWSCSNISSVVIKNSSNKLELNGQTFDGVSSTAKLYVSYKLLEAYQADPKWTGAFKGGIYEISKPTVVTYTDGTTKKFDIKTITSGLIENISNAVKVEIGDSVTKIADNAFANCHITSVTIPDSVVKIGTAAFLNCPITSVTIPDSVVEIGERAFWSCSNISSLKISSGITTIELKTFYNCYSLKTVDIPKNVTYISDGAFSECSALSSVTIENSASKLEYISYDGQFEGISSTAKLYVPSNLLADYQADTNWTKAFKGGIYAIADTTGSESGGVQSPPVD